MHEFVNERQALQEPQYKCGRSLQKDWKSDMRPLYRYVKTTSPLALMVIFIGVRGELGRL